MLKELGDGWRSWLTSDQGEVCKEIANELVEGKRPSKSEVIHRLTHKILNAEQVVHRLLERGILEERDGKIVRSIFITSEPTRHKVAAKRGSGTFVWCAADALVLPLILGRDLSITSSCPVCESEIRVRVEKERIASAKPLETVVLLAMKKKKTGPVWETLCPYINFFCSDLHLNSWLKNEEDIVGAKQPLSDALQLLRLIFMPA